MGSSGVASLERQSLGLQKEDAVWVIQISRDKYITGKRKGRCKSPEAGACRASWENRVEASVATEHDPGQWPKEWSGLAMEGDPYRKYGCTGESRDRPQPQLHSEYSHHIPAASASPGWKCSSWDLTNGVASKRWKIKPGAVCGDPCSTPRTWKAVAGGLPQVWGQPACKGSSKTT